MWSPFPLLLIALYLRSVQAALSLSGPSTVTACETAIFTWTDGVPPYGFHPLVGTGGVAQSSVEGLLAPTVEWYVREQPAGATVQIVIVDASGDVSNALNYPILNSGACASSSSNLTVTASTSPATVGVTSTRFPSSVGDVTSTFVTTGVPTRTAGDGTTQTIGVSVQTSRAASPTSQPISESAMTLRLSISTTLTIVATVGGALFLVIGLCCWRWCRTRKGRKRQRRSQPRHLMKNADLNGSGLLLTDSSSSRQYGPIPTTPNSGGVAMMGPPLVANVLPSSKERRMRGAVNREADLEDGLSISDVSGPISTAHSTSIWPASTIASPEDSPSQARFPEPVLRNQQSLQAIIGREIQEILHNSESRTSPTSFGNTPSPFSSMNDLQSSYAGIDPAAALNPKTPITEKPNLSLEIPQTDRDPRSILHSAATPISRRDMEVLADLVAQRLISGRAVESPARDHNPEAPPPRYS